MSGFRAHDEQRAEFEIVRLTKQLETRVKARVSAGSDPDGPEIDSNRVLNLQCTHTSTVYFPQLRSLCEETNSIASMKAFIEYYGRSPRRRRLLRRRSGRFAS